MATANSASKKLFLLTASRSGYTYYVTGDRVDQGRWTKSRDKARRFTEKELDYAKGNSHAKIVPIKG